jgi:putative membrane-bound dehydrogenase-like protein
MRRLLVIVLCFYSVSSNLLAQGLKVPPGFEVAEFADDKLANDIHVMTIDPKGRVLVAGRGYIRILVDDDGDGKADRAIDFAAEPKDGAMGLLWEGDSLFVMGDGGLRRFTTKGNGNQADGPSELIRAMKTGGEHTSHAIRRGPDGWLYVLCGNTAGIDRSYAQLASSPVKEPTAGCVLRFQPDFKKCEIVAHGFRNPYGMDFNLAGDLFTFDADNERCVSLPWYEPTRFYHVMEGGHYGWLNPQHAAFWRRPAYFFDVVAPIATLGRGSPTGVACYAHNQFPPEYHGGFFLCDWTFGKIHFAEVERKGTTYRAQTRIFLESLGDNGFAPTACAVHPLTGDLYVSIGGRGTRGAVYRIRHRERFKAMLGQLAPLKAAKKVRDDHKRFDVPSSINVHKVVDDFRRTNSKADRLYKIRLVQLGLGDIGARNYLGTIWEGYTPRKKVKDVALAKKLAKLFPSGDSTLDYEYARTFAMLGCDDAELRSEILNKCSSDFSSPIDDIHYLACYARLEGKRADGEAKLVCHVLLDLDRKIAARKLNRDSNWPLRLRELYVGLAEKDASLHQAMIENPAFGRPDHALFANTDGFPKEKGACIFLERWQRDKGYTINGHIVELFDILPADDVLPTVRKRWGDTGQESALLLLLAKKPVATDRKKLIDGLSSPQSAVVTACVGGLKKLNAKGEAAEWFALIHALHRTSDKQVVLRKVLVNRLQEATEQSLGADSKRWIAWLQEKHPELGKRLANPDGVDVAKWDQRLAKLDWTQGKAADGKAVYRKASCVACHSGAQAIGPDLAGVAARFSRADLFTAILQPSKDVAARYQTTVVETRDGKTYQGIVIYDAVDSLILQTGASTTVRMDGASVVARFVSAQSLMPAGLLDPLSDREIVDLYAYLRSLGKAPAN